MKNEMVVARKFDERTGLKWDLLSWVAVALH